MKSYFHGGVPDLKPGDMILPPSQTNAVSVQDIKAPGSLLNRVAAVHSRDRVYLHALFHGAIIFAATHPSGRGVVYECEPQGLVEHDPDYDGPAMESICCPSAKVLHVFELTKRERRETLRALGLAAFA